MRKTVEKILQRYGCEVTFRRITGDKKVYGFMQHTGSLSWQNMRVAMSPLGQIPRGQYLLLIPVDPELRKGDYFCKDAIWYVVRRVEKVMYQDETIYCWCLCEEGGDLDFWGS